MISVIIPVYNVEQHLDRCLNSVVDQSYQEIEILIVDDGSTDNSPLIIDKWREKDKRIRCFRKKNEGLGSARNYGLQRASGQYLTFLDSDDWWKTDFLEKMVLAIKKYDADIAVCDINYVDSETGDHKYSKIRLCDEIVEVKEEWNLINKIRTFAWGKLYKKELFDYYHIRYPDFAFEDIPCTPLLTALSKRVAYVPEALCNYFRNRNGSLSNTAARISDMKKALECTYERFVEYGLDIRYHTQLEMLLFSQVRFIYKKFYCKDAPKSVKKKVEDLLNWFIKLYPVFDSFQSREIIVPENEIALKAARNLVFDDSQIAILRDPDVKYIEVLCKEGPGIRYDLGISDCDGVENDEKISWDISDKILAMICRGEYKIG